MSQIELMKILHQTLKISFVVIFGPLTLGKSFSVQNISIGGCYINAVVKQCFPVFMGLPPRLEGLKRLV